MYVDNCRTSLQFVEQRPEARIAKIDAARVGEKYDTVKLENVQTVFQCAQCTVDIGQRQCRESTEAVGTFLD